MRLKNKLLAGVAMTMIALPAMAEEFNPARDDGVVPCGTFVIEQVIDGVTFTSTPFRNVAAEISNFETQADVIRVNGRDYQELRVSIIDGVLFCTGIPLAPEASAAGS